MTIEQLAITYVAAQDGTNLSTNELVYRLHLAGKSAIEFAEGLDTDDNGALTVGEYYGGLEKVLLGYEATATEFKDDINSGKSPRYMPCKVK